MRCQASKEAGVGAQQEDRGQEDAGLEGAEGAGGVAAVLADPGKAERAMSDGREWYRAVNSGGARWEARGSE